MLREGSILGQVSLDVPAATHTRVLNRLSVIAFDQVRSYLNSDVHREEHQNQLPHVQAPGIRSSCVLVRTLSLGRLFRFL